MSDDGMNAAEATLRAVKSIPVPTPDTAVPGQFAELQFSVWALVKAGYMACDECAMGPVDKANAEECEACCEHELCPYHQGVEDGTAEAIRRARKSWGIT